MKKFFPIAVWVVVISGVIAWWVFVKNDEPKIKLADQAKAKEESIRKAIIELADKHNAVVNWGESLSKKLFVSPIFTIEVEDALLRKDNRPVLFFATVKDVERKENKYLVRFVVDDLGELPMIEFILDCTDEQTKKIIQQQIELSWEGYAVIAEIQKIRKVMFNLGADSHDGEADEYNGKSKIRINTEEDVFIANGKCLDLLFVGDYSDYDISKKEKEEQLK